MELFIHTVQGKTYVTLLDDKMRIIQPVHDYLNHIRLLGHSINTLRLYGIALKIFWQFLLKKKHDYKNLTPNHISEYIEYLLEPSNSGISGFVNVEAKRSAKTINKYISILKQFYEFSSKMEDFDMDIAVLKRYTLPPFHLYKPFLHHTQKSYRSQKSYFKLKEVKYQFKILSDDECEAIENALLTTRDKLICRLLKDTGMRIGEVLSLHIEDIPTPKRKERAHIIHIKERSYNKAHQKLKSGNRTILVPTDLLFDIDDFIINERVQINTKHSFLLVSMKGKYKGTPLSYKSMWNIFRRVSRKTGIRFSPHDFRHTFCTRMIEDGFDIRVVQELAGHKNIYTTQQYVRISKQFINESFKNFQKNKGEKNNINKDG